MQHLNNENGTEQQIMSKSTHAYLASSSFDLVACGLTKNAILFVLWTFNSKLYHLENKFDEIFIAHDLDIVGDFSTIDRLYWHEQLVIGDLKPLVLWNT